MSLELHDGTFTSYAAVLMMPAGQVVQQRTLRRTGPDLPRGSLQAMSPRKSGARLGLRRGHLGVCEGRRARRAQRPGPEQGAADDRAAGEDAGDPPERG